MATEYRTATPPTRRRLAARSSRGTAKGLSLHIGLNHVDPSKYQDENGDPWDGELAGCINDARDMQDIAVKNGFRTTLFTDDQATSAEVIKTIARFATELSAGDTFVLTYSGHGGQVPDVNGDEPDGMDETWCLFDRQVGDDELYNLWSKFQAGVRIFVLSDSCHSGTVLKQAIYAQLPPLGPAVRELAVRPKRVGRPLDQKALVRVFREHPKPPRYKNLPWGVQNRNYQKNKTLYDTAQWAAGRSDTSTITASLLLISGCQDNQLSSDGDENGLFTQTLLDVWENGSFEGDYPSFAQAIIEKMPGTQTPNYYKVGADHPGFEAEKPFTIGQGGAVEPEPVPDTSAPSITADLDSVPRDGDPPTFQVQLGSNPYYIVEIASDYDLFVNRPSENTAEFYATYYDPDAPDRETGSTYTLPVAAWDAVQEADRLYYRIGTTSSESGWDDYTVSTEDGVEPPSIEIAAAEGGGEVPDVEAEAPSITADLDSVPRDGEAPTFQINTGSNSYYIVEVASDYDLFVNRPSENTAEFYATYYDQDTPDRETGSTYTLPDAAWEALKAANRLYYRIGTTSSESAWDDYTVSTEDGVEPPSFEVTGEAERVPPKRGAKLAGSRSGRASHATAPPKARSGKTSRPVRSGPPRGQEPSPWLTSRRTPEEAMRSSRRSTGGRKGVTAV